MIFFLFDTSAAVKRYKIEPGTDVVGKICSYRRGRVFLPSVCISEVLAVFESLHQIGQERPDGTREKLTRADADKLKARFYKDVHDRIFWPLDVDYFHCWGANAVHPTSFTTKPGTRADRTPREPMDALDTLVVCMALDLRAMFRENLFLVVGDGHMLAVARKLKIKTLNPQNPGRHEFLR